MVQKAKHIGLAPRQVLASDPQEERPIGIVHIGFKQTMPMPQALARVGMLTAKAPGVRPFRFGRRAAVRKQRIALPKNGRAIVPHPIVFPSVGHKIVESIRSQQSQGSEERAERCQQPGRIPRHQTGQIMTQLALNKRPVLEHIPVVIRRLEARIRLRSLDRKSGAVVDSTAEAQAFVLIQKNGPGRTGRQTQQHANQQADPQPSFSRAHPNVQWNMHCRCLTSHAA